MSILHTILIAAAMLAFSSAKGAYPLIVDDAGVHQPGQQEWDFSADASRFRAADALGADVLFTAGLLPRFEGSVGFGYGWIRDRRVRNAPVRDGVLDVNLGLKVPIIVADHAPFALTLSAFAKLPTASPRFGLGTGYADANVVAIATRSWGNWSVDVNGGFTWTSVGRRSEESGDSGFAGVALRWQVKKTLMVFAETFGNFPTDGATQPVGTMRAGWQWQLPDGALIGSALGTGYGRDAARALGTLGLTINY